MSVIPDTSAAKLAAAKADSQPAMLTGAEHGKAVVPSSQAPDAPASGSAAARPAADHRPGNSAEAAAETPGAELSSGTQQLGTIFEPPGSKPQPDKTPGVAAIPEGHAGMEHAALAQPSESRIAIPEYPSMPKRPASTAAAAHPAEPSDRPKQQTGISKLHMLPPAQFALLPSMPKRPASAAAAYPSGFSNGLEEQASINKRAASAASKPPLRPLASQHQPLLAPLPHPPRDITIRQAAAAAAHLPDHPQIPGQHADLSTNPAPAAPELSARPHKRLKQVSFSAHMQSAPKSTPSGEAHGHKAFSARAAPQADPQSVSRPISKQQLQLPSVQQRATSAQAAPMVGAQLDPV